MAGTKLCMSTGTFGPCMGAIAPGMTDCSTASDKNCNGKPDNSECGVCTVAATQYCYDGPPNTVGVGACKQGTQVCQLDASGTQAVWGTCAGEVTPALSDTCDTGNDATCNNMANEGCTCLNGQSGACGAKRQALGNCAAGTTKCVSGSWGACSIVPAASDTCNSGDDASCNGKVNEGCACINGQTQACGTSGTGCTLGSQTCAAGAYGGCGGNSCVDFAGTTPTQKCSVSFPNGEPNDNSCVIGGVCAAGYHVTNCSVFVSSGNGSCSFDGADGADPTAADVTASKPNVGTGATCAISSCTCRRDGF
jgi:hypothetical protein